MDLLWVNHITGRLGVNDLSKKLKLDRATICHHLTVLQTNKFIMKKYYIVKEPTDKMKGIASTYYLPAEDKTKEIIFFRLCKIFEELKN